MKILFVGRKFGGVAGGVERTSIALMGEMIKRGHSVSLLTWDVADAQAHYDLDPTVRWRKISMGDAAQKASWLLRLQRQFKIRSIVRDETPDVIIGFQQGAFLAVRSAIIGLGIPVIAAERNAPQRFNYLRAGRRRAFIFMTFLLAAKVTVQFEEYGKHYPNYLRSKIVHIPNPVLPAEKLARPGADAKVRKLLFVGHLSYQKNPVILLQAFLQLADQFHEWQLDLIGDGEYRAQLEEIRTSSKYADRINFLGLSKDVGSAYAGAHLFCLPSLWEGFPNALAEAMAHGLPAIGFAESAGINILIEHGKNGFLAAGNNNVQTLAETLRDLMSTPERRQQMGKAAIESVAKYEPSGIFDQWENLFSQLAKGPKAK